MDIVLALVSIHPSIAIHKFWQGNVEMVLRVLAIVLGFSTMIASADVVHTCFCLASQNPAGWVVFTSVMVVLKEVLAIMARYLNFHFISAFHKYFIVVDLCVSGFLCGSLFIGGIVVGVHARLGHYFLLSSARATVVLSFLLMFEMLGLGAWMVLFLLKKWNNYIIKYTLKENGSDSSPITDSFETN